MQNPSYQSANTMYKFTGKERDNESSYDYFGARYYDSRTGRWGRVEPLLEKYISWSPYNYSLDNSVNIKDIDGLKVVITGYNSENTQDIFDYIEGFADFDISQNDGNISLSRELSKKEFASLDAEQQELYNAIRDEDNTIELVGLKDPMTPSGKAIIGGGYEEGAPNIHYIHLETAEQMQSANIYDVTSTILHELLESWLMTNKKSELNYNKAHGQALQWFPWGSNMRVLNMDSFIPSTIKNGNTITVVWYVINNAISFYSYNLKTRNFQYLDVISQLEKLRGNK